MTSALALTIEKNYFMELNFTIPCPNCGGAANRRYSLGNEAIYERCQGDRIIQTECPECDYLLVMCSLSGSVIEACPSSTSPKTRHLTSSLQKSSQVVPLLKPLSA
jgi:endogenous inhibitor of DNA gyrase (YacG/DUF329 family)